MLSRRFTRFFPPNGEPYRYHCDNPYSDGDSDLHAVSTPGGRVTRQRRQVGETLAEVDALFWGDVIEVRLDRVEVVRHMLIAGVGIPHQRCSLLAIGVSREKVAQKEFSVKRMPWTIRTLNNRKQVSADVTFHLVC
jgi:hypothetical protein